VSDPVAEAAQAAGVRLSVTPEARARSRDQDRVLDQEGFLHVNARWPYAKARIFRILGGSSRASTIEMSLADAEVPKLAHEFMNLFAWYAYFRHRQSKWNPFAGLSDEEAGRKFVQAVIDICDRSTGKAGLGHWYTK
jgi:hypothetical protein